MTQNDSRSDQQREYCKAPCWISVSGVVRPILPLLSLIGLAIVLLCICCVLAVVEFYITRKGGKEILSHGASVAWQRENAIINANNTKKISQKPVWNSIGHPYPGREHAGKRILVLGDSFSWGDGNANMNYIWWRQLQWSLNRRGYWDVEVVACGGLGGNTENELRLLRDEKLAEKVGADLVIIGYVTNDPIIEDHRIKQLSGDRQEALAASFRSPMVDRLMKPVLPNIAELLQERIVNKRFYQQPVGPDVGYPYSVWEMKLLDEPNWTLYSEVVKDLGAYIATTKVPIFVVTLPNYPVWKQFSARFRKLTPLYRNSGVPFYDTLKAFVKRYPVVADRRDWYVNPANGHPGPRSTSFFAEQAADILERDFPESLGEKKPPPSDLQPRINDWVPYNLQVVKQDVASHEWQITFPRDQMWMLSLPIGKPHILLSFEMPVAARGVHFSGTSLRGAELSVKAIDPAEGFDPGNAHALGVRVGKELAWTIGEEAYAEHITELRIAPVIDAELYQQGENIFTLSIDFDTPSIRL